MPSYDEYYFWIIKMLIRKDNPTLGGSVGSLNTSKVDAYAKNTKQKPEVSQAENLPARVIEAKRELLRDYGHEVAIQAADYAGIVANFISADDKPGLQYATAKFVAFARETAKTCRELIDGRAQL